MSRSASISSMPAMHRRRLSRGLTLIELLLFVVVVGIALSAMLKVFVTATMASADPVIRRQQHRRLHDRGGQRPRGRPDPLRPEQHLQQRQ